MVWVELLERFLSLFRYCELSHFSPSIYRQWVPLVSATSLTVFLPIVLKLCICFFFFFFFLFFFTVCGYACGLGIIVRTFAVTFFPYCESFFTLNIYVMGTSCERNSSYSFEPIVLKLCICFLHGIKNVHVLWV